MSRTKRLDFNENLWFLSSVEKEICGIFYAEISFEWKSFCVASKPPMSQLNRYLHSIVGCCSARNEGSWRQEISGCIVNFDPTRKRFTATYDKMDARAIKRHTVRQFETYINVRLQRRTVVCRNSMGGHLRSTERSKGRGNGSTKNGEEDDTGENRKDRGI